MICCLRGVEEKDIIQINLDKRGFKSIKTAQQLEQAIEERVVDEDYKYLFIDEIQNVEGFEEVINAFREEGNFSIFITGSNSYLLSGELTTKLTGRYIEIEMFPLNFYEFIEMKKFRGVSISENNMEEFNEYVRFGGFPKTLEFDEKDDSYQYVQVAMTIMDKTTEDREYKPFSKIRDNYPKYLFTLDQLLQKRDGILHCNMLEFISKNEEL